VRFGLAARAIWRISDAALKPQESQRILLTRLKSLGDIVFTLPAVHQVRAAFPEAAISFLVSKEYASLMAGFRDVGTVLALDRSRLRRFNPKKMTEEVISLFRKLRQSKFGLVVDFQGYGETALLTWLSGAPERWGSVYRGGRKWAYTRRVRRDPSLHPVDCFLALVREGPKRSEPLRNEFVLPESAIVEAEGFFRQHGLDPVRQTLFIQPFTSAPHKNWRMEGYLAAARHWQDRGVQVLFGGGPADMAACRPAREAGFPVAAGSALLVSAGLMKLATVVLGSDTGLLHLAVAMGKRVVMLLPSTGPGSCHPFQHKDWSLVPPAGQAVSAITAEAVISASKRALEEERRDA
jgi:ADP-heptose:LPS heptosyltransferase